MAGEGHPRVSAIMRTMVADESATPEMLSGKLGKVQLCRSRSRYLGSSGRCMYNVNQLGDGPRVLRKRSKTETVRSLLSCKNFCKNFAMDSQEFMDIVQQYRALYDRSLRDFKDKNKKNNAWYVDLVVSFLPNQCQCKSKNHCTNLQSNLRLE